MLPTSAAAAREKTNGMWASLDGSAAEQRDREQTQGESNTIPQKTQWQSELLRSLSINRVYAILEHNLKHTLQLIKSWVSMIEFWNTLKR